MKNIISSILVAFFLVFTINAQNKSFNLDDASASKLRSSSTLENKSAPTFQNASKSRELVINPVIQSKELIHVNDTIILGLFSDKQYKAFVDKIDVDVNGTTTIRARILNSNFGYCIISTFNGKSFMTVEVPDKNELYMSKFDQKTKKYYLLQIDKSKQKALEGAPSLIPPSKNQPTNYQPTNNLPFNNPPTNQLPTSKLQNINPPTNNLPSNYSTTNIPQYLNNPNSWPTTNTGNKNIAESRTIVSDPNTRDTITLMIVYTPAAAAWSESNETDINNTISLLMAKAQLALDNSNTLMTIKLVFTGQINYSEFNDIQDLYSLTDNGDGWMDNVHSWRDAFCADVVVLLENIDFTGGVGWLLNSSSGLPQNAFSITRVQQASWTYSTVHEIAHNMGCHHPKLQNFQPGPGLYSYSAGWRWNDTSGVKYCDVMTYESGSYFADGINATTVPYFSNPDIQYQGVPTGNAFDGDNARTIREMKSVVASYRDKCNNCTPPTTQATAFTTSSISDNSMVIDWTRGNGNSVLVVASLVNTNTIIPENGKVYIANNTFGSGSETGFGNYVVYNGAETSVNITALTSGTTYHYAIYEYNSTSNCYLIPELNGYATTTGISPSFQASQWTWQNPYPQGNPLYNVQFISATDAFAVGECGTILKTTDGGTTWDLQTSGTINWLLGVSFTDANNGTVVGDYGTILRTTDGGKNWSTQSSGTPNALYKVIFTDINTGTAVGANGTILRTTNGGNNWTAQLSRTINTLLGVSFTDANVGSAVGFNGIVLRTTNGGNTWTKQTSGTTNRLFGVSFTDTNNGITVGDLGSILKTIDGGANWTTQSSGTTNQLYGVCFNDINNATSVGLGGTILKTIDGGTTWNSQTVPGWGYTIMNVSFYDNNNGIVVGGNNMNVNSTTHILKTTNGGALWTDQVKATTDRYLADVDFMDTNYGVAVSGFDGEILTTKNGGISWTLLYKCDVKFVGFRQVYCIDSNNWIAVGARGNDLSLGEEFWSSIAYRTTDGGITWTSQSIQPPGETYFFAGVAFTDANNGIIVGGDYNSPIIDPLLDYDPLILRTTNGGLDWIRQSIDVPGRLSSVYFKDAKNGFATGMYTLNNNLSYKGYIIKTIDGGITWTMLESGLEHGLGKIKFFDEKNGVILTDAWYILKTTDGGTTWTEQYTGNYNSMSDIFLFDANNWTSVGIGGGIYNTKNAGTTWIKETSGTKLTLDAAYFTDVNNGIIVGQGGLILKKTGNPCLIPSAAGLITGKTSISKGDSALVYSIDSVPNATSYTWAYSGTGLTISNSTSNSINVNFAPDATSGNLTVKGINSCSDGATSTLFISINYLTKQDSLALVALYNATDGPNWTRKNNWLTGPLDSWEGVTIESGRVVGLNLGSAGLNGKFPAELSDLISIRTLNLSGNQLTDSLTENWSSLVNLQNLDLSGNHLSGTLPESWSALVNLQFLQLNSNQLSGNLPSSWSGLINLALLNLSGNQISGKLPDSWSALINLQFLNLSLNQFTGALPDSWSALVNLCDLDFSNNKLSGILPGSWSALANLQKLKMYNNQLSGILPGSWSSFLNIINLYLDGNHLSGMLPESWSALVNLQSLDLSGNQLSGTLPDSWSALANIQQLFMANNQLSGILPESWSSLLNLRNLDLSYNKYTGVLSDSWSALVNLQTLILSGNQFTGALPDSWSSLVNLYWLFLYDNKLTGLPNLSSLTNLDRLMVQGNMLDFGNIESNIRVPKTYFSYSPQAPVGVADTLIKKQGEEFRISIAVEGKSNKYQWYKNGVSISGATGTEFVVPSVSSDDAGDYTCQIANTVATELTLQSQPITLQISNQSYTQNIPLIAGWNIISSNVIPSITNLKDMVQPLIDDGKLNKVMDESGKVIEDFGAFGGWQNGIGTFSQAEGYKVNMTGTDALVLQGNAVKLPFSISLSSGWNITPYPCANAQSALTMVQSLIDIHTLDKVMDESGKVIEDFGAYGGWKNNIGDFTAGKGYKIKVNQSCTLTINSSELRSATKVPTVLPSAYFMKAFSGNGTDHMNIHLVDLAASSLQIGDEIGIFDGKVCVGSAAIGEDQVSDGSISIPASCNDALGGTVNGYIPGHSVELRLYREGETFDLTLEKLRGSDTFEKDGSLFAKVTSKQPTNVSNTDGSILFFCHPNPFAEEIQIDVRNSTSTKLTVEIYNLFGQKIKMLYEGANTGLLHLKWNGTNDKGNRIVAGVYLCRVNDQSKKIVFIGGK